MSLITTSSASCIGKLVEGELSATNTGVTIETQFDSPQIVEEEVVEFRGTSVDGLGQRWVTEVDIFKNGFTISTNETARSGDGNIGGFGLLVITLTGLDCLGPSIIDVQLSDYSCSSTGFSCSAFAHRQFLLEGSLTFDVDSIEIVFDEMHHGDLYTYEILYDPIVLAPIDIKFCSGSNSFNCKSKGVLPMTVFGTEELDVSMIDINSVKLCLADETACLTSKDLRNFAYDDVGDPQFDLGTSQCTLNGGDGIDDLELKWESKAVVNTLLDGCKCLSKGETSPTFVFKAMLLDGTPVVSVPENDKGIDQLVTKNGGGGRRCSKRRNLRLNKDKLCGLNGHFRTFGDVYTCIFDHDAD